MNTVLRLGGRYMRLFLEELCRVDRCGCARLRARRLCRRLSVMELARVDRLGSLLLNPRRLCSRRRSVLL